MSQELRLVRVNDHLWEIPPVGRMNVPGRIYADKHLLPLLKEDQAPQQVANVACLPGIVKYSLAMPDIHWGYGFPIGGVAAFDMEKGVISPGGIGFDINCGLRLLSTHLVLDDVKDRIRNVVDELFETIPSGVGSKGAIPKLSIGEAKQLLVLGVKWAVDRGYGTADDLPFIEDHGTYPIANPDVVSDHAIQRGLAQIGTLGSGNHFLEIDVVSEIFDESLAQHFGLKPDGIVLLIHTGSRGFGYQICSDYSKEFIQVARKYGIDLVDRQLACAPLSSAEAKRYLAAMGCAANFAWVNRQVIMALIERSLMRTLGLSKDELGLRIVYDVCHNIAKIEEHLVDGERRRVCVHRKGATRALPAGHSLVPEPYQGIGQPVIVPGDMGRASYLCVGLPGSLEQTFGSTCHGAGRVASRGEMIRRAKGMNLRREMEEHGVYVRARSFAGIAEEMPDAYKDVGAVVDCMETAGVSKRVARFKPIGCVKG